MASLAGKDPKAALKTRGDSPKNTRDNSEAAASKATTRRPWQNCVCILLSSYLLWAPAAVSAVLHVWSPFNLSLGAALALPLSLVVLATTWTPHLQAALVKVKGQGRSV